MGDAPTPAGWPDKPTDICPGYLVQLPQVIEAARASSWRREGALSQFYGDRPLTEIAINAIDAIAGASRQVENHNIRQAREGND